MTHVSVSNRKESSMGNDPITSQLNLMVWSTLGSAYTMLSTNPAAVTTAPIHPAAAFSFLPPSQSIRKTRNGMPKSKEAGKMYAGSGIEG